MNRVLRWWEAGSTAHLLIRRTCLAAVAAFGILIALVVSVSLQEACKGGIERLQNLDAKPVQREQRRRIEWKI